MSIQTVKRKSVLPVVLAAFVWAVLYSAAPLPGAFRVGSGPQNQATELSVSTEMDRPGAVEEEGTSTVEPKPKRFPWLLVGMAVVVLVLTVLTYRYDQNKGVRLAPAGSD